jgi:hypothetical protein
MAWLLPLPWSIFGNGAVIFLLPVQRALNEYWAIEQPGVPVRHSYSAGEAALLLACGLLWLLLIVLAFVADRAIG